MVKQHNQRDCEKRMVDFNSLIEEKIQVVLSAGFSIPELLMFSCFQKRNYIVCNESFLNERIS